jgi:hypothetical protein
VGHDDADDGHGGVVPYHGFCVPVFVGVRPDCFDAWFDFYDAYCHIRGLCPALTNGLPDLFGHADFETTNNGANGSRCTRWTGRCEYRGRHRGDL